MNALGHASTAPAGPELDGRRILAAVIDLALVILGGVVLTKVVGMVAGGDGGFASTPVRVVLVAWALYYFFALESGDGQTVGKKAMKLRVVAADGSALTMREVAIRTVLRVVDVFAGLVVMIATKERRQRLGDIAAGTMVADASVEPAEAATESVAAPEAPAFAPPETAEQDAEAEEPELPEQPTAPEDETFDPFALSQDPAPQAEAPTPVEETPVAEPAFAPEEPEAEQPSAAEFAAPEPVAPEPMAEEQAVAEPVVEEPVVEEPAAIEPFAPEPVVEEPATPEPVAEEPAAPEPFVGESAQDEPVVEEPAAEEPVVEEPAAEEPVVEEPAMPEPVAEEPAAPEHVVGESAQHEPAVEELAPWEPVAQGPVADEPTGSEDSGPTPEESLAMLMGGTPAEPATPAEPEPEPSADAPPEDGDVSVRSVETMSAIDMVMGADEEDRGESPEGDDDRDGPGH